MIDNNLKKVFSGGISANQSNDKDSANENILNPPSTGPPCIDVSGGKTCLPPIDKSECPPGKIYIFPGGCH